MKWFLAKKILNWLNDLTPRGLMTLAGAVFVLMFLVIYGLLSYWSKENLEEHVNKLLPPVVAMQTVVVAKSDIPPLTIIKKEMLEVKEVPQEMVSSDAIVDMTKILNTSSKSEIFAGDVITERKLFTDLDKLTFVGSIPPDCRAVSISVNEITGVNGFAKSGDKVDLVLVENEENFSATANILLQDVLLLSINKDMSKNSEAEISADGKVKTLAIDNPSIATFALRPDEVLKLVSATKLGEIYLMLRPQNPTNEYFVGKGYTIDSINSHKQQQQNNSSNAVAPSPAPAVNQLPAIPDTPPEDPNKIEIIQGDEIVK